ncbi:hypothetical protein YC2023_051175 [Brassica napus]
MFERWMMSQFDKLLSFVSRVQRLFACGRLMLLPPPKLQAISPRVFVIGDYVVRDVSHELACVIRVMSRVTAMEALLFCKLVGDRFWIGVRQLVDFRGWKIPAGTSPEQPQIATMKEKPSLHPKRESRALQTRFGGTEERSITYESDPQTVNFISVLPLVQKEPGNGRDIIGKISMPADHLSDRQIDFAFTTTLEMKLLWLSKWCPIGVKLVSMDRGHIVVHYDRRDLKFNGQLLSYSSVCSIVQLCQNIILI